MKLYFPDFREEQCYPLSYIKEMMQRAMIPSSVVTLAKIEPCTSYFYCISEGEVTETDSKTCGKFCDAYKPRNGKSGRCRYHGNCYTPTETKKTIITKIEE